MSSAGTLSRADEASRPADSAYLRARARSIGSHSSAADRMSGRAPVFITWERHRRTREIAAALHVKLVEVLSRSKGMRRYPSLVIRTIAALVTDRPTHLIVQCPSIVLALLAVLLRPFIGYRLVIDLHNEAVEPFINKSSLYTKILAFLHRSADLGVVTNDPLCAIVRANGGRPFVLPDRVPEIEPAPRAERPATAHVVFVCTFAPDEPFTEVIEAGRLLGDRVALLVTGRPPASLLASALPPNVSLTGFVPEAEYERLLREASVVVDLTAMENCLVCGAYESVALGKPLVTSDTRALRSHFRKGTVHTQHDAVSIASAIREAITRSTQLELEMDLLRPQLKGEWDAQLEGLIGFLGRGAG